MMKDIYRILMSLEFKLLGIYILYFAVYNHFFVLTLNQIKICDQKFTIFGNCFIINNSIPLNHLIFINIHQINILIKLMGHTHI